MDRWSEPSSRAHMSRPWFGVDAHGVRRFWSHNLLEVSANEDVALLSLRVALLTMSAFCLAGVAVLLVRRRDRGRPVRRSRVVIVDAFALGLVMIAALFVSASFDSPITPQIRSATFATLSLAPIVFLAALLNARLARSAVGDLLLELPAEPAPEDLRDSLARALRDPSLELAYWLPDFGVYADLNGRPVQLPALEGRAMTLIDRDGDHVAVLIHDPALEEEPELLDGVQAAAGIALENARLHADLRARLRPQRLPSPDRRGGPTRASVARAQPPRRRPATLDRPVARPEPARRPSQRRHRRQGRARASSPRDRRLPR